MSSNFLNTLYLSMSGPRNTWVLAGFTEIIMPNMISHEDNHEVLQSLMMVVFQRHKEKK